MKLTSVEVSGAEARGEILFGAFCLDLRAQQLRQGDQVVHLRPKGVRVLHYLLSHGGALVTQAELLEVAWSGAVVTPNTLTNVVAELRQALGDDRAAPRFIETVHRRGYRFIGEIIRPRDDTNPPAQRADKPAHLSRPRELMALQRAWQAARRGERQVVFVSGEAGVGKSWLVDQFLRTLNHQSHAIDAPAPPLQALVHCVEQGGDQEPYMPVLVALEQFASGTWQAGLTDLLRRYAPTWLAQLPWLIPGDELSTLRRGLGGAGAARMLREGAALLDAMAQDQPLILVIEDLHWADPATMEWIMAVAQRDGPAKLVLIGTYRPFEAAVQQGRVETASLRLRQQQRCVDLPLGPLVRAEVACYLAQRLDGARVPKSLIDLIVRRSGGNPLFVDALVSHLMAHGWLVRGEIGWTIAAEEAEQDLRVPGDLLATIESQAQRLPPRTLEVLEAGSVEGQTFGVAPVAAALSCAGEEVEEICHRAASRNQFIQVADASEQPGGQLEARYSFVHALYALALYQRIAPARRRMLHQRIGEAIEQASGTEVDDVALAQAMHFEAANDFARASRYRALGAAVAARRFEYAEAALQLERALAHLGQLPRTPDRDKQAAQWWLSLANTRLLAADRNSFTGVHDAFVHAQAAAASGGARREHFRALLGLGAVCYFEGRANDFLALAVQQLEMTANDFPEFVAPAHYRAGEAHAYAGDFRQARIELDRSVQLEPVPGVPILVDIRAATQLDLALVLSHLGLLRQADQARERGLVRLAELDMSYAHCDIAHRMLELHVLRRDLTAAAEAAQALAVLAEQYAVQAFRDVGALLGDWARSLREPGTAVVTRMRDALARQHARGEHWQDVLQRGAIAEACLHSGELDAALDSIELGLTHASTRGARRDVLDLWRLRAEVRRLQGNERAAAADLRQGIDLARAQGSLLMALRLSAALGRLLVGQGELGQARDLLRAALAGFDDREDAPDLHDARTLLTRIGPR